MIGIIIEWYALRRLDWWCSWVWGCGVAWFLERAMWRWSRWWFDIENFISDHYGVGLSALIAWEITHFKILQLVPNTCNEGCVNEFECGYITIRCIGNRTWTTDRRCFICCCVLLLLHARSRLIIPRAHMLFYMQAVTCYVWSWQRCHGTYTASSDIESTKHNSKPFGLFPSTRPLKQVTCNVINFLILFAMI